MPHLEPIPHETLLTGVITLAGLLWSLLRAADLAQHLRRARLRKAVLVLQAAVDETWRTYVQAIKAGRADGKLTAEEARRARELAKARAYALARREGVDLLRELGPAFLDLWVAKTVKRLKSR